MKKWLREINFLINPSVVINEFGAVSLHQLQIAVSEVRVKKPILLSWSPPTAHIWKLNVDGSSKNNKAGGGGIFRNAEAHMLMAFSEHLGEGGSTFAELKALETGLILCYQMGIFEICVETDSLNILNWFKGSGNPPWCCWNIWKRIRELASWISVEINHIYREQNKVADHLAKLGASGSSDQYYQIADMPKQVLGDVIMDIQQVPSWRF